jgi:heptose I phosphotransferase
MDLQISSASLVGGDGAVTYGSFWERLVRGVRWSWIDPRYQAALPPDLDGSVMSLVSRDRLHTKQGRSTARVIFHDPFAGDRSAAAGQRALESGGQVAVYLKRHFRLPWPQRLAALINPAGRHSPAAAEWAHLQRAQALGVPVPEVVATGERIGPWACLQSYLMVAELTGSQELNIALPVLARELKPAALARLKRRLIAEMARIIAALHAARVFHKDLYLCHIYLDVERSRQDPADVRLVLIDLHRLAEHRVWPDRWRWKDLGQLLYSAIGVGGIDQRDISRFWKHYRRRVPLRWPRWQARMIQHKAEAYLVHNRGRT